MPSKKTQIMAAQPRFIPEAQAESEALFRSIGDGAITTDEFGHVTRTNPTALSILGLKPDEIIGKWYPRVVPLVRPDGTPVPLLERPIVKMFLIGKTISEKVNYRAKNGRIIPLNINASPIIFHNKPVGAVEIIRDITLENEIDRMKSEFISLASHQLRTPLSTVKTYTHMLSEGYMGDLSNEQQHALQTIIAASDTMNELIAILLNIARMESGSIEVTSKHIDASQAVKDVMGQLRQMAGEHCVSLIFRGPERPIALKSDNLILKEVLSNLIGNAIKYTRQNGSVTVTVRNRPDDVLFTIRDTGIGIPHAVQDKIFSKFFRASNVVRRETTGTGLGLYVVKGLVETLNGRVWFKSEENAGTIFYVSLPREYHKKSATA